jgi:hypothetical protein
VISPGGTREAGVRRYARWVDPLEATVVELVTLSHTRPLHEYWRADRSALYRDLDRAEALLGAALADPMPETRRFLGRILRELGRPAPLVALLEDPDDEVRLEACVALAREPFAYHNVGTYVYPPIDEALRRAILASLHAFVPWKPYVIEATIRLCVGLRDPDLGALLASRLRAKNWRDPAMRSFSYAPDGAAHLARYVRDVDPAVRASACVHLTYSPPRDVPDDEIRAALVERLDDVPEVEKYAVRALRNYPDPALEARFLALLPREEAIDALTSWQFPGTLPAILELARSGVHDANQHLEKYPMSSAIEQAWIGALASTVEPFTKYKVALLLSRHGTSTAVPALERYLARDVRQVSKRWRKDAQRRIPVRLVGMRAKPPLV